MLTYCGIPSDGPKAGLTGSRVSPPLVERGHDRHCRFAWSSFCIVKSPCASLPGLGCAVEPTPHTVLYIWFGTSMQVQVPEYRNTCAPISLVCTVLAQADCTRASIPPSIHPSINPRLPDFACSSARSATVPNVLHVDLVVDITVPLG